PRTCAWPATTASTPYAPIFWRWRVTAVRPGRRTWRPLGVPRACPSRGTSSSEPRAWRDRDAAGGDRGATDRRAPKAQAPGPDPGLCACAPGEAGMTIVASDRHRVVSVRRAPCLNHQVSGLFHSLD